MTKEEVMEEVSKRLSEAAASAPLADQMKEPVWHEAGAGMNVEQLRIGKRKFVGIFLYLILRTSVQIFHAKFCYCFSNFKKKINATRCCYSV